MIYARSDKNDGRWEANGSGKCKIESLLIHHERRNRRMSFDTRKYLSVFKDFFDSIFIEVTYIRHMKSLELRGGARHKSNSNRTS